MIYENERVDEVNDRLSLIQKTDGLTFGTDALLLAGYVDGKFKRGSELGGGSGIISMLLLAREKTAYCEAYEVQEEYADLIERNARLNKLEERLKSVHTDIRELENTESFDLVFTNPPYMKADSGKQNTSDKKSFARHEHHGDIEDFCITAKKLLKFGGAFYAVYRPDRLATLICAMRENGIEPKRLRVVAPSVGKKPSLLLIEGRKDGKEGLIYEPDLYIYTDNTHTEQTQEIKDIYSRF
jgi:tRNA1(Val) A37 N6-methylase TrmN6